MWYTGYVSVHFLVAQLYDCQWKALKGEDVDKMAASSVWWRKAVYRICGTITKKILGERVEDRKGIDKYENKLVWEIC